MFWGEGLFVFPLMLLYTIVSYTVFDRQRAFLRNGGPLSESIW